MAATGIHFSEQAREAVVRGATVLADAVRVTLGPRGRTVIIEKSYGARAAGGVRRSVRVHHNVQGNHMYRRILAPVDGSAASMIGLKHAIGLAKDQHARLRVLNVIDDMIIAPMMIDAAGVIDFAEVADSLRAEGRKVLEKAATLAGKSGVKAETIQVESRGHLVSEVILADARRSRADVIVMGTHGRRGLNRLLLGSDAERVLRETPVPVLLTRHDRLERGSPKRKARR